MKNPIFPDLTIQCDKIGQVRVPDSCAPFSRTLLSCQNPLNCHMGQQQTKLGRVFGFCSLGGGATGANR